MRNKTWKNIWFDRNLTHLDDLKSADRHFEAVADEEHDDDRDEGDGGADRPPLLLAQASR